MSVNTAIIKKNIWDMILFTAATMGCGGLVKMLEDVRIWIIRIAHDTFAEGKLPV